MCRQWWTKYSVVTLCVVSGPSLSDHTSSLTVVSTFNGWSSTLDWTTTPVWTEYGDGDRGHGSFEGRKWRDRTLDGWGRWIFWDLKVRILNSFVYYESIKWDLNRRPMYEYLCDERLKTKVEGSQDTHRSYIKLRVLHVSYTGAGVKDTMMWWLTMWMILCYWCLRHGVMSHHVGKITFCEWRACCLFKCLSSHRHSYIGLVFNSRFLDS